jgi:hypothetical protein
LQLFLLLQRAFWTAAADLWIIPRFDIHFYKNYHSLINLLQTAFDPVVMKNAEQIFYTASGFNGFLHFLGPDMAR